VDSTLTSEFRINPGCIWILAIVLAIRFLPASAIAQAGLSGNPFGGQVDERTENTGRNSQFDNGTLKSQSALGQLEEMTGATVDRSSTNQNTVTRVAPRPKPVQPRYDPNLMIKQQVTGALADALVNAIFSDDSAEREAQAQAEAQARAEAEAQAEALRVQQELARQARIRQAQHYRAEWDSRETEITNQLGGAFDVGASTGTAFFGRPANPDANTVAAILGQDVGAAEPAPGEVPDVSDSDPSVVDLRGLSGDTGTVTLLPPGAVSTKMPPPAGTVGLPRWVYDWPQPPPQRQQPSWWGEMVGEYRPMLREQVDGYGKGVLKDATIGRLWGMVPGHDKVDPLIDFEKKRESGIKELWKIHKRFFDYGTQGASNAVGILASGNTDDGGYTDEYTAGIPAVGHEANNEYLGKIKDSIEEHLKLANKEKPVEEYVSQVRPVDAVKHPDESRLTNVEISRINNTSSLITNKNINGVPESYGSPPE
jgi:hypothetical protein